MNGCFCQSDLRWIVLWCHKFVKLCPPVAHQELKCHRNAWVLKWKLEIFGLKDRDRLIKGDPFETQDFEELQLLFSWSQDLHSRTKSLAGKKILAVENSWESENIHQAEIGIGRQERLANSVTECLISLHYAIIRCTRSRSTYFDDHNLGQRFPNSSRSRTPEIFRWVFASQAAFKSCSLRK